MLKKLGLGLVVAVVVLAAVVVGRTARFRSRQLTPEPCAPLALDEAALRNHLSQAIQCRTVSYSDPEQVDKAAFVRLHGVLQTSFPRVHATMRRETVAELSLLYTWPGTAPELAPVLLMAHLDVVAADPAGWEQPPFSGAVADGFLWGRGAADDKGSVMALLEAAEALIKDGFTPKRTLLFAFGHDEEVGGVHGARSIAALLAQREIAPVFSFDEGLVIADGIVPGVAAPVALIAVAEKGYLSLDLTVRTQGGHSSQPPRDTAIGILARAVARLEAHPMPARLEGPVARTFAYAGPEMPFLMRMLFANLWLFEPLVKRELEAGAATNAALRTTTAPTIIRAGAKDNVLPAAARAVVNFRILPGDTVESVTAHAKRVIADDRVALKPVGHHGDPSPVSSDSGPGFTALATSIRQVWPEAVVAPSLQIGGTDSKNYVDVVKEQYRFTPFRFTSEDLPMIHGKNERVSLEGYAQAVRFYAQVMRNIE